MRVGSLLPVLLEVLKCLRRSDFIPIVFDIEQFAAGGTGVENLFDTELFPARRIDALLINGHGTIVGGSRQKARG
jgi:hypothetical protein